MNLELRARDLSLTPSLREYCERRIAHALGRFGERIERVALRLSDVNGPRGGKDKRCRILVALSGGRWIVLEEVDASTYTAIDSAAGRIGQTVARELARARARSFHDDGLRRRGASFATGLSDGSAKTPRPDHFPDGGR